MNPRKADCGCFAALPRPEASVGWLKVAKETKKTHENFSPMSGATEDTPRPSPPSSAAEGEARLSLGPWRHFSRVYGQPSSRREGRSERRKTPRDCSRREEAGRSPEEEARLCRTTRRGREGAGRSADTRRGRARRRGRDDARRAGRDERGGRGSAR